MNQKMQSTSIALLFAISASIAGTVELDVPANFEIQAKKNLYSEVLDRNGHNLDQWWGRVNVSVLSKSATHEGKVTIRAYPPDFGFNQIMSYTPDRDTTLYRLVNGNPVAVDSTLAGSPITSEMDKFLLYEAYLIHRGQNLTTKVGRFSIDDRNGFYFGNYTDNLPGGDFFAVGPTVNALELSKEFYEVMHVAMQLESGDENLNRGNLRAYFHFHNLPSIERLEVGMGYRGNVFDYFRYSNAEVFHNVSIAFNLPITNSINVFMETAAQGLDRQDSTGRDMEIHTPVTGGFSFPVGRAFQKAYLEVEWDPKREKYLNADGKLRRKEVLGSLMLQRQVSERFTFTFGAFSHENTGDFSVCLRMRANIN